MSTQSDPHEWLRFAQDDLAAARLLLTDVEVPARLACFHAQEQAAEKALKASLVQAAIQFRKTHDLVVLVAPRPLSWGKAVLSDEVASNIKLSELSDVLEAAMGWLGGVRRRGSHRDDAIGAAAPRLVSDGGAVQSQSECRANAAIALCATSLRSGACLTCENSGAGDGNRTRMTSLEGWDSSH